MNPRLFLFPIASLTFTIIFWMLLAFLPIYLGDRSYISPEKAGLIMGTYSISAIIFMVPLGVLSDRLSSKKVLLGGALLLMLHILGLGYSKGFYGFLASAFLGGIAWSIFQTVLYALFLKVISEERKGFQISLYQTGLFVGFGVGPLIGGFLWSTGGFSALVFASFVATLLLSLIFLFLPDTEIHIFSWKDYKGDIFRKQTFLFFAIYLIYGLHFGVEQAGFSVLMKKNLFFSSEDIGIVYMAVGVWMGILAPLTGNRFDSTQKIAPLFIGGIVISSVFHILTAYAQNLFQMVLVRILHTLGDTPVILSLGILTALLFPQERMGGNSAVTYMVRTMGAFSGNVLTGFLMARVGADGAFIYTGFLLLLASLLFAPFVFSFFGSYKMVKLDSECNGKV